MAIKVNGTTVIDDSRNLTNVGGMKTVNGNSLIGSGNISAGASTTAGAVGTYTWGRPNNRTGNYSTGSTAAGCQAVGWNTYNSNPRYYSSWDNGVTGTNFGGTWRCMARSYASTYGWPSLWVRIS